MAATPEFTGAPFIGSAVISIANTNRDGTGTLEAITTGSTNGRRISQIDVIALSTTTAGMVRLFLYDGSANTRLWREVPVTAITPDATTQTFQYTIYLPDGLILPSGWQLQAGTHNGEQFAVWAFGGDF